MLISNLVVVIYYNFESHFCMVADEGVHEIFLSLRGSFNVKWQTFIVEMIDLVKKKWEGNGYAS